MPPPTVEVGENLLMLSFDESDRIKRKSVAYSTSGWKLPEWTVVAAAPEYALDVTVKADLYRGLLLGFDRLDYQTRG